MIGLKKKKKEKPNGGLCLYGCLDVVSTCLCNDTHRAPPAQEQQGGHLLPDTCAAIAAGLVLTDGCVAVEDVPAAHSLRGHVQLPGVNLQLSDAAHEAGHPAGLHVQLRGRWHAAQKRRPQGHLGGLQHMHAHKHAGMHTQMQKDTYTRAKHPHTQGCKK